MGARHEIEVVISATIKSELGKFIAARPVHLCKMGARPEAGWARTVEDAMRRYVQEDPKIAILVETMREEELVANFEQVRAKACAMDVPCLKVVVRKPGRQRGEAW